MEYSKWLNLWIENYVEPSNKSRTCQRYRQIVVNHVIPFFENRDIEELSPLVLQQYVAGLLAHGNLKTGKGLAPNTVNAVISVVQNSLKTAHALGYAKEYSANMIKRPKTEEKKVECFTLAEQKKIESAVLNGKKSKMFGVVLCLYTGLRIGELLALKWSDIDMQNGLLSVSKSCYDASDGKKHVRIEGSPKTAHSTRIIPLPKQLLPLLKDIKKHSKCEYVVADGDKPVWVRSYQRSFELLLKKLNIPHKGFHSLRHTFATRALECGMDVKTLSEILGHKNPIVTLNRYAHSLMEHKSAMMNRLGKLL